MPAIRFKIFSDPVHGFISVPRGLVLDLIESPEVQRLRRIRQLGLGSTVFPSAEHTRFGHALGAMALLQETLKTLHAKGTPISDAEYESVLIAGVLHDLGHGPFSHTLEHHLIRDFHHEQMSRALMLRLNERFGGALELALRIFDNQYERPFLHALIASQLDMDRLDYLRRDAFYTGVVEGRVGVERILKTLRVHPLEGGPDAQLVVEEKGAYAIENYLTARRLMYWQVYLHKTVIAGDELLHTIFERVRYLVADGASAALTGMAPPLAFFLTQTIHAHQLDEPDVLTMFCALDDVDVLSSLKRWCQSTDLILAHLCQRFLQRDFFRVVYMFQPPSDEIQAVLRAKTEAWLCQKGLATPQTAAQLTPYFLKTGQSAHAAYSADQAPIHVLTHRNAVVELSQFHALPTIRGLSQSTVKPYLCYPKELSVQPTLFSEGNEINYSEPSSKI